MVDSSFQFIENQHTRHNKTLEFQSSEYTQIGRMAAYNSMVHRLLTIPMSLENFEKERKIIKQVAHANGFRPNLIDKIIENKEYKMIIKNIFPIAKTNAKQYISLTYFGDISNKIGRIITKYTDYSISFKSYRPVESILGNFKEKTDILYKSGVYKLNCSFCNSVYIGQTLRNFHIRYCEHLRNFRLKQEQEDKSNF